MLNLVCANNPKNTVSVAFLFIFVVELVVMAVVLN